MCRPLWKTQEKGPVHFRIYLGATHFTGDPGVVSIRGLAQAPFLGVTRLGGYVPAGCSKGNKPREFHSFKTFKPFWAEVCSQLPSFLVKIWIGDLEARWFPIHPLQEPGSPPPPPAPPMQPTHWGQPGTRGPTARRQEEQRKRPLPALLAGADAGAEAHLLSFSEKNDRTRQHMTGQNIT